MLFCLTVLRSLCSWPLTSSCFVCVLTVLRARSGRLCDLWPHLVLFVFWQCLVPGAGRLCDLWPHLVLFVFWQCSMPGAGRLCDLRSSAGNSPHVSDLWPRVHHATPQVSITTIWAKSNQSPLSENNDEGFLKRQIIFSKWNFLKSLNF